MPAQQSVGLHNEERLLPSACGPCEHDQEHPIGLSTSWTLHLSAENDELLSQECVFSQKFSPGAYNISEGSCGKNHKIAVLTNKFA